jgi:hypothetical protein
VSAALDLLFIHNYRELLGETNLTRASFLGPAGLHQVRITV